MQFGKVQGIALLVLGLVLILVQFAIAVGPKKDPSAPSQDATKTVESKIGAAPGIVGALFLFGGIAVIATARRRDEPPPQRAVK